MKHIWLRPLWRSCVLLLAPIAVNAQSDVDAIMMGKKLLCAGVSFQAGQWNRYWEGTFLRTNENIGTVRTTAVAAMGSYGLTKNLNLITSLHSGSYTPLTLPTQ